jgi:hypothetical protein
VLEEQLLTLLGGVAALARELLDQFTVELLVALRDEGVPQRVIDRVGIPRLTISGTARFNNAAAVSAESLNRTEFSTLRPVLAISNPDCTAPDPELLSV